MHLYHSSGFGQVRVCTIITKKTSGGIWISLPNKHTWVEQYCKKQWMKLSREHCTKLVTGNPKWLQQLLLLKDPLQSTKCIVYIRYEYICNTVKVIFYHFIKFNCRLKFVILMTFQLQFNTLLHKKINFVNKTIFSRG